MKKGVQLLFTALLLSSVVFADAGGGDSGGGGAPEVVAALTELKNILCGVLGSLIMVLIVLAAIAYAAGHILGAETGARAKVWGQNILIGAGIALVIYIVAPIILGALYADVGTLSC